MEIDAACLGAGGAVASLVGAQDKPADKDEPAGWSDKGELSYVVTGGNAETSTVGFKNTLGRAWERSAFELKAGGIRAESTTTTRTAVGPSSSDFNVVEEGHHAHGGELLPRRPLRPEDLRARLLVCRRRLGQEPLRRQEDVVEDPDAKEDFAGARLSSKLQVKFGENGTYGNDLAIDENLDDTSDLRADMTKWVAVGMSDHLALEASLQ